MDKVMMVHQDHQIATAVEGGLLLEVAMVRQVVKIYDKLEPQWAELESSPILLEFQDTTRGELRSFLFLYVYFDIHFFT